VSALLHALVAMTPTQFNPSTLDEAEEELPVTSYPCQWKPPRQRKQSNTRISDVSVEKHTYGKQKKIELLPLEEFDPRPPEYRDTASSQLTEFLGKVRGKGLGVSLLFDPNTQYWQIGENPTAAAFPSHSDLCYSIEQLKKSLEMSEEACMAIERDTREQRLSSQWFSVRRYRLTASHFGDIFRRRRETKPDALVLKILHPKQISSAAIDWGVQQESTAIEAYKKQQLHCGNQELTVNSVGFLVNQDYPFLGASPDGKVHDPSHADPFGFLEVKCPYSHRAHTPREACSDPLFCCELQADSNGLLQVTLKRSHKYFSQVQGQMAIGRRSWCDFVVYTTKGVSIERIAFDASFWNNQLLPKLTEFYDNCMAPEIISPVHMLGMPLCDLRDNF